MDFTQSTIQQAYQICATSKAAAGTIGIVTTLAILYIGYDIVSKYLEIQKSDGSVDFKVFFKIIQKSIFYIMFFAAFPFLIYGIENAFATMQDSINQNYSTSVNNSAEHEITKQLQNYLEKEDELEDNKSILDKLSPTEIFEQMNFFEQMWASFVTAVSMFCIYVLKYLYFFFVCGRYLWLILLQIVGPIALVLSLHKNTFSFFTAWCKNMFLCYLMIPAYMIANVFSESVIEQFFSTQNLNEYGLLGIIGVLVLKLAMFGVVTKKLHNLI